MEVQSNVAPGGRPLESVISTHHGDRTVLTGIHQRRHDRRQGGVRFVTVGSLEELAHLAHGMSEKAAAAGIAIDGMKALVICPAGIPESAEERASFLADHIRQAISVDRNLLFGPDMGCQEDVLDIVATKHGLLSNVTGLSREHGGLDIDVNGLTAHGVTEAIRVAVPDLKGRKATIQGFGAVGAHTALMLHDLGVRIVGVSNLNGTYRCDRGLEIPDMFRAWSRSGDAGLPGDITARVEFDSNPNHLLTIPCDIFVPAARTSVLGTEDEIPRLRAENPDVSSIEAFLAKTDVQVIAEAANHPLSFAAEHYAFSKGVQVLPDIIINPGGLVGCCYEHDHRMALQERSLSYELALDECRSLITDTVRRNLEPASKSVVTARHLREGAAEFTARGAASQHATRKAP